MILCAPHLTCAFPASGNRAYGSDTYCPHTKAAPRPRWRGATPNEVGDGLFGGSAHEKGLWLNFCDASP
jgi:hypothetical protein